LPGKQIRSDHGSFAGQVAERIWGVAGCVDFFFAYTPVLSRG
jgi:hypothetical protein